MRPRSTADRTMARAPRTVPWASRRRGLAEESAVRLADGFRQTHQIRIETMFHIQVSGLFITRKHRERDELAMMFLRPAVRVVEQELAGTDAFVLLGHRDVGDVAV